MFPPAEDELAVPPLKPAVHFRPEGAHLVAVGVQPVQVLGDIGVFLELGGQDRRRGPDVSQGRVGLLVLPAQVEPGGGREIPGSSRWKMNLGVDEPPTLDARTSPRPLELGQEEREVETPDVESRQVAGLQKLGQALGPWQRKGARRPRPRP